MTKFPHISASSEDVLLAFAVEALHDHRTLATYVARYPEYAEALAELAVELKIDGRRTAVLTSADDPAVDRAWQIFLSALPLETKSLGTAGNLLANLPPAAFRALAEHLDVNALFLSLVRDRAITLASMPTNFLARLAAELNATLASLVEDLQRPPMVAAGQKFKADKKPEATAQITFNEALTTSHLTEQQQAKLKALME